MTYIPKPDVVSQMQAPAGVAPWRDLSDAEFATLDEQFGPLGRFFDHVAPQMKKKAARAAEGTNDAES